MLAGTSLQAHRRADGDFELRRAGAEAAQLAPVVVLGAGATTEGSGLYTADWMRSANGLVLSQRDTPQSTSVITRQQMDDRAIGSVRDVMENATGMNVQQAESERLTYYSRGFSMDTFQFDGVVKPLNSLYQFGEGNLDPAIYDHVEIIRGATGLMSGTGNPGGSVNFIRKRPTREFREAKVSAGSHDTYRGEIDLSTPFNASGSVRGAWSARKSAVATRWISTARSGTCCMASSRPISASRRRSARAVRCSARVRAASAGAACRRWTPRASRSTGPRASHGREVVALGHGFP